MKAILFWIFIGFSTLALGQFDQRVPNQTNPEESEPMDSLELQEYREQMKDEINAARSAIVPGWGQIENKQYIKSLASFALVSGGLYWTIQEKKEFNTYNEAYKSRLQNFTNPIDEFAGQYDLDQLYDLRTSTRSKKDIATAATAYVYFVNIFDAAAQYKLIREEPDIHSATRAAYYSAILPGLGQAYNKKYWKVPIVWGALGAMAYVSYQNRDYHRKYEKELEYRSVGLTTGFRTPLTESQLQEGLEYWRKWRDASYIGLGVVYALNVVDATVDAHLYDFNVDDDLSFKVAPKLGIMNDRPYYAVQINYTIPTP